MSDNWGIESRLRSKVYRRNHSKGNHGKSSIAETLRDMEKEKNTKPKSDACHCCSMKFGILHRRHICSRCGFTVCSRCSNYRVRIKQGGGKSRVCVKCFPLSFSTTHTPLNSFIHAKAWVPRGIFVHMLSYLGYRDIIRVSSACRWWYKRSSIDLVWKSLYGRQFPSDYTEHLVPTESFYQPDVHGIPFDALSWKKKFALRYQQMCPKEQGHSMGGISELLKKLELSKYQSMLDAEEIDMESLCLMNSKHLKELGIPTGPRLKLLNAIALLAEQETTTISNEHQHSLRLTANGHKSSLVRRVQQTIVRIAVLTANGTLCNVGSGTIIHPLGLIATARHCLVSEQFNAIEELGYIILVAPTESASRPPLWKYSASVLPNGHDEELDCALLWLENEVVSDPPSGLYIGDVTERTIARNWTITEMNGTGLDDQHGLPWVPIGESNKVEPGDEMWMFGYPSSGHNTITIHHAICSGTDEMRYKDKVVDKAWLRTAAQLDNGFSGGAAVNRNGELVGLISFSVLRQDRVRAIHMLQFYIDMAIAERISTKRN